MKHRKLYLFAAAGLVLIGAGWFFGNYVGAGGDMTRSAQMFLESLSDEQRDAATMKYEDPARLGWHFIPKDERKGLQVKNMAKPQRERALALLRSALSEVGYKKSVTIMELEAILHELEKDRKGGNIRDPERYYFTIFGQPDTTGTWGLSIEGHHLSLNFVVRDGKVASSTPAFFGANPGEVKQNVGVGPKKGTRVLRKEEDLAFELFNSLEQDQQAVALLSEKPLPEIRSAGEAQAPDSAAEGLAAAKMTEAQVKTLWSLLRAYSVNMPTEVAETRLARVKEAGIENVHFAWAGADKPGIGHYYRVQGPTFLIEFVNVQPDAAGNPANHIHLIWRDMAGDFAIKR